SSPTRYRIKEILERLKQRISSGMPISLEEPLHRQRIQKHFQVDTTVKFEQVPAKDVTQMIIATADRPGLLARIGKAFLECNIRVHKAKISTAGERADDTFDITDMNNQPLLDEAIYQQIRNALNKHLSQ
ncbi:MAG TPA: [protein-PII] uridylyltransferase, partial [Gammaproteobacteria bacterium]